MFWGISPFSTNDAVAEEMSGNQATDYKAIRELGSMIILRYVGDIEVLVHEQSPAIACSMSMIACHSAPMLFNILLLVAACPAWSCNTSCLILGKMSSIMNPIKLIGLP